MIKAAFAIIFSLALVEIILCNPTRFQRDGKSMLYQYFHRPGQSLYVRGYENEPEFEQQQNNQNQEVCLY